MKKLKEAAEARARPHALREAALREHILTTFAKDDIRGARGSGLSLSLVTTTSPQIEDWGAFVNYARKKGNADLLNRAVNSAAWRARLEEGVQVPGVGTFTNVSLRVTQLKGKGE